MVRGIGGKKMLNTKKKINNNVGKIIHALISIGFYDFKITSYDEYVRISIMELTHSPFSYILVYDNIVHYYDAEGLQFEGVAKNKKGILMDVFNK